MWTRCRGIVGYSGEVVRMRRRVYDLGFLRRRVYGIREGYGGETGRV
jgi:hypothetical protein